MTPVSIDLTASSRTLVGWPWLPNMASSPPPATGDVPALKTEQQQIATPDQIDESYIASRTAARADFNEFANELGYLGKQLYIGYNFGETIIASAIFNGTDIRRGEGVLTNFAEFAYDIYLGALYVAVDNLYLHIPGLPPIISLPRRGPADAPLGWQRPQVPLPHRPLVQPDTETSDTESRVRFEKTTSDVSGLARPSRSDDTTEPEGETERESIVEEDITEEDIVGADHRYEETTGNVSPTVQRDPATSSESKPRGKARADSGEKRASRADSRSTA
ncbi:hypothetical protein CRI77_26455 [Mycolicibacterium duvalii]|nr:hypothetical protein CRI77_26455 [Mycolicibacterium duvalii]